MRRAGWAGLVMAVLLALAAVLLFGVAIWTHGPDSGRWFGTGFLTLVVAIVTAVTSACALDIIE